MLLSCERHPQNLAAIGPNLDFSSFIGQQADGFGSVGQQVGGAADLHRGNLQAVESMRGKVDSYIDWMRVEVDHYQQQLIVGLAQVGILTVLVEATPGRKGLGGFAAKLF